MRCHTALSSPYIASSSDTSPYSLSQQPGVRLLLLLLLFLRVVIAIFFVDITNLPLKIYRQFVYDNVYPNGPYI